VVSVTLAQFAYPGIARQPRSIPGIAEVTVIGGLERQIVVQLIPREMAAAKISVADVTRALEQQNVEAPVRRDRGFPREYDPAPGLLQAEAKMGVRESRRIRPDGRPLQVKCART
jgi:multidrug efflux pump subunit AcrB